MTASVISMTAPRPVSRAARPRGATHPSLRARLLPVAPVAAAVAWFVVFGVAAISVMQDIGRDFAPMAMSFARGPLALFSLVAGALSFATFGALLASRSPRNPIGWMLLATGIVAGLVPFTNVLVTSAMEVFAPAPAFTTAMAWVMSSAATPVGVAVLISVLLLFPSGHALSGRWNAGLWLAAGGALLVTAGTGLTTSGLLWYPALPNPLALDPALDGLLLVARLAGMGMLVAALLVAIHSMVVRYRHCDDTVRRQLRWMVGSAVALGATLIPFVLVRYAFSVSETTSEVLTAAAMLAACAFPAVTTVAIACYRSLEVDLLISRTLVYVPLMAILGGLYSAMSLLFQRAFVTFTGNTSDVAAVLTALIVASAFTPVRRTLESVVESRLGRNSGAAAVVPVAAVAEDEACVNVTLLGSRLQELEARLSDLEHRPTRHHHTPARAGRNRK